MTHSNKKKQFTHALEGALRDFGIEQLTAEQASRLEKHYNMMIEWNRLLNLTRITEMEAAARLHYAESLFGGRFIGSARTAVDIGSGAGFPSIPLAVSRPDVAFTALESNAKKATFLMEVKDALALENFSVANSRLEDFDLSTFDLLATRALDRACDLLPLTASRLKPGQRLMVYCGSDLVEAIKESLGADSLRELLLIPESESRFIAVFEAKGTTVD